MSLTRLHITLCFLICLSGSASLSGQAWNFVREQNGIKLYTRQEEGTRIKACKGMEDLDVPAEKVFELIENVNNTDWWDKGLSQIKILHYEKNKKAQYYLVYDLPWPISDRDLCTDVTVTSDAATGEHKITAAPLQGVVPEKDNMIRIKNFHQTWTITRLDKDKTHIALEGFIDPGGKIPDWLFNMLIVESPFRSLKSVADRLGGGPSVKKLP